MNIHLQNMLLGQTLELLANKEFKIILESVIYPLRKFEANFYV